MHCRGQVRETVIRVATGERNSKVATGERNKSSWNRGKKTLPRTLKESKASKDTIVLTTHMLCGDLFFVAAWCVQRLFTLQVLFLPIFVPDYLLLLKAAADQDKGRRALRFCHKWFLCHAFVTSGFVSRFCHKWFLCHAFVTSGFCVTLLSQVGFVSRFRHKWVFVLCLSQVGFFFFCTRV